MTIQSSWLKASLFLASIAFTLASPGVFAASPATQPAPAGDAAKPGAPPLNESDKLIQTVLQSWSTDRLAIGSAQFEGRYQVTQYASSELAGQNPKKPVSPSGGKRLKFAKLAAPIKANGTWFVAEKKQQSFLRLLPAQVDPALQNNWFGVASMYGRSGNNVSLYRADDNVWRKDVAGGSSNVANEPVGIFLLRDLPPLLDQRALQRALGLGDQEYGESVTRYGIKRETAVVAAAPGQQPMVRVSESLTVAHLESGYGVLSARRIIDYASVEPYLPARITIEKFAAPWLQVELSEWAPVKVDGANKWLPCKLLATRNFPETLKPASPTLVYDEVALEVNPATLVGGDAVTVPEMANEVPKNARVRESVAMKKLGRADSDSPDATASSSLTALEAAGGLTFLAIWCAVAFRSISRRRGASHS
ncbi:MAG TPA: hypothetical protein VF669_17775 [Tepidisphaeraceae bacterium]|jgi:hypothetical protein